MPCIMAMFVTRDALVMAAQSIVLPGMISCTAKAKNDTHYNAYPRDGYLQK